MVLNFDFSWFFGALKRAEANRVLMRPENDDGSFLIRNLDNKGSEQMLGWFMLSLKNDNEVKHYRIEVTDAGKYLLHKRKREFSNLKDFVMYYSKNADEEGIKEFKKPALKVISRLLG